MMSKANPCGEKLALYQAGKPVTMWQKDGPVQAWRCSSCGYIFFDTPDEDYLRQYYQVEYPEGAKSWYNIENNWSEDRCVSTAKYLTDMAQKWVGSDKVRYHESGCSFGGVVRKLNAQGYDASGTELNASAVAEAREKGNTAIHSVTDAEYFASVNAKADFVYSFHCLEHMPSPAQHLSALREHVSPDGVVLFHVPNAMALNSIVGGFNQNSWFAYPDHLHMFSPASALCLAESVGYHVIDVWTNMLTEQPEKDSEIIRGNPSSVRGKIMYKVVQDALMGEELCFLITPKDSRAALKHANRILDTKGRCDAWRAKEAGYLELQA